MPDRVKMLHDQMLAWRKQVGAPMPTPNPAGGKISLRAIQERR